jgi:hypothetical protein
MLTLADLDKEGLLGTLAGLEWATNKHGVHATLLRDEALRGSSLELHALAVLDVQVLAALFARLQQTLLALFIDLKEFY